MAGASAHPSGAALPRLADPEDRAAAVLERAKRDLGGALDEIDTLRRRFAPDPALLHVQCLLLHRAGRLGDAVAVARSAVPLCFRAGRGLLVAEIFEALEADAEAIGLGRAELLALGGALSRTLNWQVGFRALATLLLRDPADADAARDLLRLADRLLATFGEPEDARRVAHFLVAQAADENVCAEAAGRIERAERALGGAGLDGDAGAAAPVLHHALSGVLD